MKRQNSVWENIFANDVIDKGLISKIWNSSWNSITKTMKTNNTIKKKKKERGPRYFFKKRTNICKTEKETQMYITDFWTLWVKARVGCFERISLKQVYYQGWNKSPAQVGCMRQVLRAGTLGRPRGMGWRGRWERGSGWGTHVNPWLIQERKKRTKKIQMDKYIRKEDAQHH